MYLSINNNYLRLDGPNTYIEEDTETKYIFVALGSINTPMYRTSFFGSSLRILHRIK